MTEQLTVVYTMVIMRNTTVLNVKIDKELKTQAQEVAKAIGLPISTVVASNLREFVRLRSITISDPPQIKPEVEKELLKISAEVRAGKNVSPTFDTAQDASEWLMAEIKKENAKR